MNKDIISLRVLQLNLLFTMMWFILMLVSLPRNFRTGVQFNYYGEFYFEFILILVLIVLSMWAFLVQEGRVMKL